MIPALLIGCFPTAVLCQTGHTAIYGKIIDADSNGIAFANVLLLKAPDSVFVEGVVTDELGLFVFTGVTDGIYHLESSRVGYSKYRSQPIVISGEDKLDLNTIILSINELEEVTVKGDKPLYEMALGKMVINVQSSISSAGLTVLDVL